MKKDQELIVIIKTYDLILWSCNHTSKFPRNHRFVLGERIKGNLYVLPPLPRPGRTQTSTRAHHDTRLRPTPGGTGRCRGRCQQLARMKNVACLAVPKGKAALWHRVSPEISWIELVHIAR
jgi:hypothetical protein